MKMIAAVDENWGIGNKGNLLYHISEDMKNFRSLTSGKTVILGRKTLSTFPNGAPLKNRKNIIMSSDKDFKVDGAVVCHSVEEVLKEIGENDSDDVYVIGGESIYRLLLPYCNTAIITKIQDKAPDTDKYLPNLDELENWHISEESELKESESIKFTFCTYKKSV